MTTEPQDKGLPRGCVIGLIVAGVLLVLVLCLFVVCQIYRDDLIKFSVNNTLHGLRTSLATKPIDGVDANAFDTVSVVFMSRFDTTQSIDYSRLEPLVIAVQTAATKGGDPDLETVRNIFGGLITYYPDLKDLAPTVELAMSDSTHTPADSSAVDSAQAVTP
jgi:hypothetical protein